MSDHNSQDKTEKTVTVSADFLENIAHELGSLAQYFMSNYYLEYGESPDVSNTEALLVQACEYLRIGGGRG